MVAPQFGTEVRGVKEVIANLKMIKPEAFKQLRRDMRTEIRPVVVAIQSSIPEVAPLSGFNNANQRPPYAFPGYNSGSKPKSIGISTPTTMRGMNAADILVLTERNAAVSILDQAGQRTNNNLARSLERKGVGRNRSRGRAQRFGWPTVMQNLELVNQSFSKILDKVAEQATARIKAGI